MLKRITLFFTIGVFINLNLNAAVITTSICKDNEEIYFYTDAVITEKESFFSTFILDCNENSSPFCLGEAEGLVGEQLCIPLTARNYQNVAGFQFTMAFDTSIVIFDSVRQVPGGLTFTEDAINTDSASVGSIGFLYFSEDEAVYNQAEETTLLEFCFTGRAIGESLAAFTNAPVEIFVSDANGDELTFSGGDGTLTILPCFNTETILDTTICAGETILIGGTIFTAVGTYTIPLISEGGCDSIVTLTLDIGEVGFTLPSLIDVCENEQATVTVPAGFLLGLNGNPQGTTILLAPAIYEITVFDESNGCSNQQMVTVIGNPYPEITIEGSLEVCTGAMTTLVINGSDDYAYAWSNGSNEPINMLTAGEYTLTVTDTTTVAACEIIEFIVITELPLPEVSIEGAITYCAGSETELTASGATSYAWHTGATTASIVVAAPGEYCVTGTDDNGCSSETCVTVEELPLPEVSIEGALTYCAGSETELTASGATSYAWDTGATTASIVVAAPGEYCVTGTDNNGCSSTTCVTVEELPLPEVSIEGALTYCAGSETELTASGATSYAWDTGATTASIVVTDPGQYCVTATDDNGCSAETCVTVEELPLPEVSIEGAITYCAGSETELTASGATSYVWDTGATTASIVVAAPGEYCVTGTDDNGCSSETCVTVEELPLPEVSIEGALTYCAGSETELTASGATSYVWDTGATTASIVVAAPGEYCVTGTDDNGCSSETCVTVEELPLPEVSIEGALTYCAGSETELTASGAASYAWDTGATTASIVVTAPGQYCVTATDDNGCSAETCVTVEELPLPEVSIEGALTYCAGSETELTASGATSYAWDTGATTASIVVTAPGQYCVTATDDNGCSAETCVTVEELPLPEVSIEGALTYCAGSETELTASGATSYVWDTGATTASIVVTDPGQYCVTATDDNGCSAETCVTVEELPLPEVSIEGALTYCAGSETELTASGATSYAWDTGATTASIVVAAPGEYCVTGTDDNGCSATTCVTVEELPLPEVSIEGILNICADNETELTASGATSYTWNTGATTATIVITEPGEYCVTGTDTNGCSSETCVTVVGDTEAPVFAFCPTGASTIINFGETSGPVTWTAPLVEDNCGTNGITVESTHLPGDLFLIGETEVTYTATDAAGNSTNCIFTVSVTESAALTFFVDTLGYSISGDTFCVPIRVRNFTNVAAFQFTLEAPNTMLSTIEGIIPDPVFDSADPVGGVVYEAEDDNSGRILWLDASSDGITVPDSSIVFTVKMLITADFGECVTLYITDGLLDIEAFLIPDEAVRPTVYGGEVCVNNLIDITGEIYRIDDAPIRNAEVTLSTLDSIRLDTTDVPGRYAFLEAIGGEDYTLTPQRDFDDPEGLSVVDMIVILRHIQGRALIEDPYLLIAADVNQTMTVMISDILDIRELILGNTQEFTNNTSWRFIPVDYVFPEPLNPWAEMFPESASLLGQDSSIAVDFYGIKIGDVNLSASGQLVSSGNLNLLVTNQAFMPGSIVEVPVYAESLEALSGLQLGLQFDSELLSLVEVLPGNVDGITPDASFSYSKITEGKLPFVYLRNELTAETSTAEQHLFTLRFAALQSGYLQDHLQLNHSVLLNLAVNEELEEWPVTLNWETPTNTDFLETDFSLLQVRPNPFQQEVFLDYHSSTTATAKVQIVDVRGVLVYEQEHLLETGEHSMLLTLPLRLPTGVYHCRIKTPTNIFTTQIIKQ